MRFITTGVMSLLLFSCLCLVHESTAFSKTREKKQTLETPAKPPSGARIRIQTNYLGTSWDWNHLGDRMPPEIVRSIQRGLFRIAGEKLSPDLVESFSVNKEHTIWEFQLKQQIQWSDGHPFTAHDVAFGLSRAAEPFSAHPPETVKKIEGFKAFHSGRSSTLEGIVVDSSFRFRLKLVSPDPLLPLKLTDPRLYPARQDLADKYRDYGFNVEHMAFLGPWVIRKTYPGSRAHLSRNPHYEAEQIQKFKEIELWFIPSMKDAESLFKRNHLDVLLTPIPEPLSQGMLAFPRSDIFFLKSSPEFIKKCSEECLLTISESIHRSEINLIRGSSFMIPPEIWKLNRQGDYPYLQELSKPDRKRIERHSIKISVKRTLEQSRQDHWILDELVKTIARQLSKKLKLKVEITKQRGDLTLELYRLSVPSLDQWLSEEPHKTGVIPLGFGLHFIRIKDYVDQIPLYSF